MGIVHVYELYTVEHPLSQHPSCTLGDIKHNQTRPFQ